MENQKETKFDKKEYQRIWLQARRNRWLEQNGPCKVCGTWEDLEVDHIDPSQKQYKISTIWSRSQEVRDNELTKCQVLCKKHHLEKTLAERPQPEHGTVNMYDDHACRCDDCRSAKRKAQMRLRNPKKYQELYGDN